MKNITIWMAAVMLVLSQPVSAQNQETTTVKISGNCDMCKQTIENAAGKGATINWNEHTGTATVRYNPKKTNLDNILKQVAYAGYDNELYLAPAEAYNKLHACCKYERNNAVTAAPAVETTAITATAPLQAVLNAYFAVKDALVKSDGVAAQAAGKQLAAALNGIDARKLESGAQTAWSQAEKGLKTAAATIGATTDLATQRKTLAGMAAPMRLLAQAAKPGQPVYLQHCPMYADGKGGDWLSLEKDIKNPFYGAQMLSCGSTKATIE